MTSFSSLHRGGDYMYEYASMPDWVLRGIIAVFVVLALVLVAFVATITRTKSVIEAKVVRAYITKEGKSRRPVVNFVLSANGKEWESTETVGTARCTAVHYNQTKPIWLNKQEDIFGGVNYSTSGMITFCVPGYVKE